MKEKVLIVDGGCHWAGRENFHKAIAKSNIGVVGYNSNEITETIRKFKSATDESISVFESLSNTLNSLPSGEVNNEHKAMLTRHKNRKKRKKRK